MQEMINGSMSWGHLVVLQLHTVGSRFIKAGENVWLVRGKSFIRTAAALFIYYVFQWQQDNKK